MTAPIRTACTAAAILVAHRLHFRRQLVGTPGRRLPPPLCRRRVGPCGTQLIAQARELARRLGSRLRETLLGSCGAPTGGERYLWGTKT